MSAINVNSITGRTGLHGPVLTGVSTAADGFQVLAGEFKVNGISTFVGMSTFNGGIDVKDGGFTATGVITASGLDISNGQLNFTKADGVGINFKESGWLNIDSDNNDTNRNLSIYDAYGTAGQKTLMVVRDNGFVGINTNNPATQLHVTGSSVGSVLRLTGNSNTAYGEIEGDNVGNLIFNADPGNAGNSSTMRFRVDGTERVRITSAGNVGINSTIPRSKLHVANGSSNFNPGNPTGLGAGAVASLESSGDVALQFLSSTSTDNFIYFGDTDSATTGSIQYDHNANALSFNVNGGTERLRITSDGRELINTTSNIDQGNATAKLQVVADVGGGGSQPNSGNALVLGQNTNGADKAAVAFGLAADNGGESTNACTLDISTASAGSLTKKMSINSGGNVDIVDGNLVFETAGHGIDFSATSDGSATVTSEVLDDYEEGNGSPTVSFLTSGTATVAPGGTFKYVKIGDLVTFSFEFNLSAVSNPSGSVKIGLPFASGGGVYSAGAVRLFNVTFTGSPYLEISPSQTYVLVSTSISGSPTGSVNGTGYYFGCVSYRTTS